jgi:uncharacterized membrane protein YfcA
MESLAHIFIDISFWNALAVVFLGFVGGVLSGFTGSGGAFFMTPGMMNLGVTGVVAVASNVAHRLGNNMMGSIKHAKLGNVDRKLAVFLLVPALIAVRFAVWVNGRLFQSGGGHEEGAGSGALSNLYISGVFVGVLTAVGIFILRDALRPREPGGSSGPSLRAADFVARLKLPPYIDFPIADVRISLWLVLIVGLLVGYLDGTVAIGGFIGVPAMIYLFRVPTSVAPGTELFLAMFGGGMAALSYAYKGLVDLRLTFLLLAGSIVGVFVGAYGTKVVKEVLIRFVMGSVILLCVISRALAIPVYLRQLGIVSFAPSLDGWFKGASTAMLFAAGFGGAGLILTTVIRAHLEQRRLRGTLLASRPSEG